MPASRTLNVEIRRAVPADADAVAALYLRARDAAAHAGSILPLVHGDGDVREWIGGVVIPSLEVWVAHGGDAGAASIVGMLVLDGQWIDQLYVAPELTGRGIGTRLLQVAKRERRSGLRLWTFASNAGAHRFYERHGFRAIDRTDGSANEEGAPDIMYAFAPAPDLAG